MGYLDAPGAPEPEQIAHLLRLTACRVGLVPSRIAPRLAELGRTTDLAWLSPAGDVEEPADQARRLVNVVRGAMSGFPDGPARHATELLLGVGRTRGLLRKDRRLAAAQALGVSREYFRKHREYQLLLDLSEEISRVETEKARRLDHPVEPSPEPHAQDLLTLTPLEPGDDAEFVADVTVPDGTTVVAGQQFTKTWEIRNSGVVTWENRFLRRQGAAAVRGLCRSEPQVPIPTTRPGGLVRITVVFTAPGLPGTCRTDWKMVDSNGTHYFPNKFGLYSIVNVVDRE